VHTTADLADGGEGLAELVRDGVGCCEDVLADSDLVAACGLDEFPD
jgi:hypothetical protein